MAGNKKKLFDHYRKSLEVAGIPTSSKDSLVCPLCWRETPYDQLTLEHLVPGSVGGTQTILTCESCNNDHGSTLDAHLDRYQKSADAFQGHGTLRTELNVNGKKVVANLDWEQKSFKVVGEASDPAASAEIQKDFEAGNVSKVKFTIHSGYRKNNFQTAVLRAAYLVLFKLFDYEYARHDVVQVIRRRIADPSLDHPRLASLILEMRNFITPNDAQHYVTPLTVNDVNAFLVIVRVRKETTTYLGAFLPLPTEHCDEFFDSMEQFAKQYNNGETLTISGDNMFG